MQRSQRDLTKALWRGTKITALRQDSSSFNLKYYPLAIFAATTGAYRESDLTRIPRSFILFSVLITIRTSLCTLAAVFAFIETGEAFPAFICKSHVSEQFHTKTILLTRISALHPQKMVVGCGVLAMSHTNNKNVCLKSYLFALTKRF